MNAARVRRLAAVIALVVIAATGCKFNGIYSFPLPGAVANGGRTYTMNIQFRDVQELVPYSAVKVNDATVGHVKSVGVQGHHALVVVQLNDTVKLPANTTALISQTSLLGEKFVALQPPPSGQGRGNLTQGMTIGLANTDTDATVEEVLGALSLVLNGGGLEQIQTITTEINKALSGREGNTRGLLEQLKTFATGLDNQKSDIITALEHVDHLAQTIHAQESSVTNAIDRLPTALKVLSDNRAQLTKMLTALSNLGDVAVRVINGSRDDLLANLRNLQPTLTQLAKAGDQIPKSLQILITFPQADGTEDVYRGDYTNVDLQLDFSKSGLFSNFGLNNLGSLPGTGGPAPTPTPQSPISPLTKGPVPLPSSMLPSPTLPPVANLVPKATTPSSGKSSSPGGILPGGIPGLGPNAVGSATVENGPLSASLTTPLDRLLLGVLQ